MPRKPLEPELDLPEPELPEPELPEPELLELDPELLDPDPELLDPDPELLDPDPELLLPELELDELLELPELPFPFPLPLLPLSPFPLFLSAFMPSACTTSSASSTVWPSRWSVTDLNTCLPRKKRASSVNTRDQRRCSSALKPVCWAACR